MTGLEMFMGLIILFLFLDNATKTKKLSGNTHMQPNRKQRTETMQLPQTGNDMTEIMKAVRQINSEMNSIRQQVNGLRSGNNGQNIRHNNNHQAGMLGIGQSPNHGMHGQNRNGSDWRHDDN